MPILNPETTLYDFATNEKLFGSINPKADTWLSWNTLFKVLSGKDLNKAEGKFFHEVSGGLRYRKGKMPKNVLAVIGRGGGKSFNIGRIAQHRILTFNYPLAPGQKARNLIISPNFRTGDYTLDYIFGLFDTHERLKKFVAGKKKTEQIAELRFTNSSSVSPMPMTRVSGRGPATWTLILEEAAHFKTEGRFSDDEVFKSARPSMNRLGPGVAYFIISSPYAKEGLVYRLYKKFYGVENDRVLVIQGACKTMDIFGKHYVGFNPTLTDEEMMSDLETEGEEFVKREYLAEFVDAISAAFDGQAVEDCVMTGMLQLPYNTDYDYFGVLDPAGLSENSQFNDEFTAGVAHVEERQGEPFVVVDAIKAWSANKDAARKSTPAQAVDESIALFQQYQVSDIVGDRFAIDLLSAQYEEAGFHYEKSKLNKWDLYHELIPVINNRRIAFVADETATTQLKSLERKKSGTRGKIDHAKGRHDDRANVIALASYIGQERAQSAGVSVAWI